MKLKPLADAELKNKTVLIRFDGDVPEEHGKIADTYRLEGALPTIRLCLDHGANVVLLAHRGRPEKRDPALSNRLLAPFFEQALKESVVFCDTLPHRKVDHPVVMLENLRYWPGEEANDAAFSHALAQLGDIYCNDAFADSHRVHASIVGVPKLLPHYAGDQLEKEVKALTPLLGECDSPYYAVLGGAKASDKSPIIADMIERVDGLFIGGLIAVTYLAAQGYSVGAHKIDAEEVKFAQRCLTEIQKHGVALYLPVDYMSQKKEIKPIAGFAKDNLMLDTGPQTNTLFSQALHKANTIFWNGAMGKFEDAAFAKGTHAVAQGIAMSGADVRILGGGDTTSAVHEMHMEHGFSFISTGGGATLDFVAGRELAGIKALEA